MASASRLNCPIFGHFWGQLSIFTAIRQGAGRAISIPALMASPYHKSLKSQPPAHMIVLAAR
jgi:hypothetical protein